MKLPAIAALLVLPACNVPATYDGGGADAALFAGDAPQPVSVLPVRDCASRFAYPLGRQASRVAVAGQWNNFSASTDVLTDGLFTNTYRGAVTLPPGSYGYKFVADGTWTLDPTDNLSFYVGGTENSRLDVPDCVLPNLEVTSATVLADRTLAIDLQYVDGSARSGMDASQLNVTIDGTAVAASAVTVDEGSAGIQLRIPVAANDKYMVRVTAKDRAGHASDTRIVPMWVEDAPFVWGDGPMYFVFTDRFRNGDPTNDAPVSGVETRANYQGGDWAGVIAALRDGYFDHLGIRTIWLSPVNENTHTAGSGTGGHMYAGYHGYWVTQPRQTEPRFGSLDTLKTLVAEAHHRGIRVIFDVVNNQLHREHVYYQMHRDWFNGDGSCVCGGTNCDWDARRLDCWFTDYLPDVNWTNMAAVDKMVSDSIWWMDQTGADGFRCDAVKHMQDISSTTLRQRVQQTLETGNSRYYLVGETFTGGDDGGRALISQYISNHELVGQFDFPLFWAIDGAFAHNSGTMGDLDGAVAAGARVYGAGIMSPFLGNHDVARFLSRAAGDIATDSNSQAWSDPPAAPDRDDPYNRAYLAFAFLLTQPGVPLIYYGDEIGMPGTADPDNRRMMRFGGDVGARESALLERVSTIARLRSTLPGLRRGTRRTLHTDGDGYVYARGSDQSVVLVAINRGTTARAVDVTVPADLAGPGVLTDRLGGRSVRVVDGHVTIPFTPQGVAIYSQ